ncbi:MAG: helix-turn-helix domain-containing protein [Clostridia bacterium]|nr:helix-turn-helix domain-containing protein [Clostridia bacterium]
MDVIERIEKLRLERQWTKYRLAEEAMLTYSTLSAVYLRGTPPKLEILEMLCNAFGITLAQFFAGEDDERILSKDEEKLLALFRALPKNKKQAVLDLLEKD